MNSFLKRLLFLTVFLFIAFTGFTQFAETTFADTSTNISSDGFVHSGFAEGKYMYISGSSFSTDYPVPTVTKTDTSGRVIWTAFDINRQVQTGFCRGSYKSGSQVFTIMDPNNLGSFGDPLPEVWSVSDSSGVLSWKLPLSSSIVQIVDYDNDYLIALTGRDSFQYHLIDKHTGKDIFSKQFARSNWSVPNLPFVFVDNAKNILLSCADSCKKFRDNRLTQLVWWSNIPNNGTYKVIDMITQDSGRYIFMGRNNVRSVDTLTGNTVWFQQVPVGYILGVQSGADSNPKDFILKDSLLYVTWVSIYVGGVGMDRAFTLTCLNKNTGSYRYNVAQTFTGVPVLPPNNDDLDWPYRICMDANNQIYMTGAYDNGAGIEDDGNWGIMKFDWRTGAKIYEATITNDPSARMELSKGKFLYYYNGKMYCAGNLQRSASEYISIPKMICFDTSATYIENYRTSPAFTYRYPSSLAGLESFGTDKMLLLKKLGRSAIIELRTGQNQLLWSKTYNTPGKFIIPQNIKNLSDTIICASFLLYSESADKLSPGGMDSVIFVKLDPAGNSIFRRSVLTNAGDSLRPTNIYSDPLGKTNFTFLRKGQGENAMANYGKGLNTISNLAPIGNSESGYLSALPGIRLNRFQHYNGDTMIYFRSESPLFNVGYMYSATQTAPGSYTYYGFRPIQNFGKVYSTIKLDANSFFVVGRSTNGNIIGARYNHHLPTALVWERELTDAGSMLNADTSQTAVYAISEKTNGTMMLTKINKAAGNVNWSFERGPVQKKMVPVDFKFNQSSNSMYVTGYVKDSTVAGVKSNYFLLAIDSSGTVFRDLERAGAGLNETSARNISFLGNGTVIYGGSISTADLGTVGFYKSDCFNAKTYTFTGSGNWNVAANWLNNELPPAVLPDCSKIIISPSGTCILNVPQTISPGATIVVTAGSTFIISGNLTILH
ncbi:MAG: hypothetical protein QM737_07940 [Ferruginibacter sp.]